MTCNFRKSGIVKVVAGILVGAGCLVLAQTAWAIHNEDRTPLASREEIRSANNLSRAFEEVALALRPSVVNIRSVKRIEPAAHHGERFEMRGPERDFFGPELFDRFFNDMMSRRSFEQKGLGTGVVVSDDGYILTNSHVVRGADELAVTLNNDKSYTGKVVGTDDRTDVAVIKIDATGLTPAKLGNSDSLKVGEWILAIGNPFGLTQTVTAGIISAKGRANVGIADYEDFIQTDAAINPGNSGGPLVNLDGEVVGISTAIVSESGGSMGIGFAIPINMAHSVMDALVKHGKMDRGYLGVSIQNLTDPLAKSFNYDGTNGVLVGDVITGGPADKAGIKPGDIIVSLNGKPMHNMNELRNTVAATTPGKDAEVEFVRDGKHRTVEVAVGELESNVHLARGHQEASGLGMSVRDATPGEAKQLSDEDAKGVVVTNVEPGSLADEAGIQPGDVIMAVGNRPVANTGEFETRVNGQNVHQGLRLQVLTNGVRRFVFLRELG